MSQIFHKNITTLMTGKDGLNFSRKTMLFVKKNINIVSFYTGFVKNFNKINQFDAAIVGSDQVWRCDYVNVLSYLLNFAKDLNIKRIAYSASFGRDNIDDYGSKLIKQTAKLAKKFDAISVREESGIGICKTQWGVDAIQLIDPAMLIAKEHYIRLVDEDKDCLYELGGSICVYILDLSVANNDILEIVSNKLNLESFNFMPSNPLSIKEFRRNIEKYQLPMVTQWLKSFKDAKFIITDSFHGTVFSIIFNKPFVAIGNKKRGLARFDSLLKLFGLEDRLVFSKDDITDELLHKKIDWERVNKIIVKERARSKKFLLDNLNFESKTKVSK